MFISVRSAVEKANKISPFCLVRRSHTLTVRDVIDALSDYPDDTPVYLKHDGGYTYGGIGWGDFQEEYDGECEDDEDD